METNNNGIPSGLAPARYLVDFDFIPSIFYGDPNRFLDMVLHNGPHGFVTAFNVVYSEFNKTVFANNPKVFKAEDFVVEIEQIEEDILLISTKNPDEHDGSLVYCKNYFFLFFPTRRMVMYLTLEDGGMGDFLCGIDSTGKRYNYGRVKDMSEVRTRILQIIESIKQNAPIIND